VEKQIQDYAAQTLRQIGTTGKNVCRREKSSDCVMKNTLGVTARIFIVCVLLALTTPACRAPVSPPSPAEQALESQKLEPPAPPAENAKPPLPDAPAVKSPKETIARHWPESRIAAPEKDLAPRRIEYNTVLNVRPAEPAQNSSWRYRVTRQGQLVGFEFTNRGGNRILPPRRDPVKNQFFARDFQFRFDERARQDIYLMVSDWVPSRDRVFRLSGLMNSLMLFFPRAFLPAIVNWQNRNIVTLPTGEEVEFDAATHEVVAGVFSEAPVDLNPDRASRKFPAFGYLGKGVTIRADGRGVDPRIGTTSLITTATPSQNCDKGIFCSQCEVPAKELWEQTGAVRFKFATDVDFDRFLLARCGFGLPRVGADFAIAAPLANR
jgi:hypothetical protein